MKIINVLISLLIALFGVIPMAFSSESVNLINIKGSVQVNKSGEADWSSITDNTALLAGDRIRSLLQSSVTMVFPDKSEFILGENSLFELKDISTNPRSRAMNRDLKLDVGTLFYKVKPPEESVVDYNIHASTASIGITGTQGLIRSKGDGRPTENILVEGTTFNSNSDGQGGQYQKSGGVYNNDGEKTDLYGSDTNRELTDRAGIPEGEFALLRDFIRSYEIRKAEGYDLAEVEKAINDAAVLLEQREYARFRSALDSGKALIKKAAEARIAAGQQAEIDRLKGFIKDKDLAGYDVASIYSLIDQLRDLYLRGDYTVAADFIVVIQQKLDGAVLMEDSHRAGSFMRAFNALQSAILEKEQQGFSLVEIKSQLRQCLLFFESGDTARAMTILADVEIHLKMSVKKITDSFRARVKAVIAEAESRSKEGYSTGILEARIKDLEQSIVEEVFLKAQEILDDIEKGLLILKKSVPQEWDVRLADLRDRIQRKGALGYDVTSLEDLFNAFDLELRGDETAEKIETSYAQIKQALDELAVPAGLLADLENLKKRLTERMAGGLDCSVVTELMEKIDAAVSSQDLNLARSLLGKAKEQLDSIQDRDPPRIQVFSFEQTNQQISLDGFCFDNAKCSEIRVNGTLVLVGADGRFKYTTVPGAGMDELIIEARDLASNISAPVRLEVLKNGLTVKRNGEIFNTAVEYTDRAVIIKGEFIPGGQIRIGESKAYCNDKGQFAIPRDPPHHDLDCSILVSGMNSDGSLSKEIRVEIQDRWPPVIESVTASFKDSVTPTIEMDPFQYSGNNIRLAGRVVVPLMVEIKGKAFDIGGKISEFRIDSRHIDLDESGFFIAAFSVSKGRPSVKAYAEDMSGNKREMDIPLDVPPGQVVLKVNDQSVHIDQQGHFSTEIPMSIDRNDLVIDLLNPEGIRLLSRQFPNISKLPPMLSVTDISIVGDRVRITGFTDRKCMIQDQGKEFWPEAISTQEDGAFILEAMAPVDEQKAVLFASDNNNETSADVAVSIPGFRDDKPPRIFLSAPLFTENKVLIEGFVDDASGIEFVQIDGVWVPVLVTGHFRHEMTVPDGMEKINVLARDNKGNTTTSVVVVNDKEPPVIGITAWEVRDGKLMITGNVKDNTGVKTLSLNGVPFLKGNGPELSFVYESILTKDSAKAVITASDLFNNYTNEGPRNIDLSGNQQPPVAGEMEFQHNGNSGFMTGRISDSNGINAIFVNQQPVIFADDGHFRQKIEFVTGPPKVSLDVPSYSQGKIRIAGRVIPGSVTPGRIVVEAEDLSGDRNVVFSKDIDGQPFESSAVLVNNAVIPVDSEGRFEFERTMASGTWPLFINVSDLSGHEEMLEIPTEKAAPLVDIRPLEYDVRKGSVRISGKVTDTQSGVKTLLINGVPLSFDIDGSFMNDMPVIIKTIDITAIDYLGNEVSVMRDVIAPDITPPEMVMTISPDPALIGKPIYIGISALDSKTKTPERLKELPSVILRTEEGVTVSPDVKEEGTGFVAAIDPSGLRPGLITIESAGSDMAGNKSAVGKRSFLLLDKDTIAPGFGMEVIPAQLTTHDEGLVKIIASEDIKELPLVELEFPSGKIIPLSLLKINDRQCEARFSPSMELGTGTARLRLTGGVDRSGNRHGSLEKIVEIGVYRDESMIPLDVNQIEFTSRKFVIKGKTAPDAVVQISLGDLVEDVIAGHEGLFVSERVIELQDLEKWRRIAATITLRLKAHNYSGFQSHEQVLELDLPKTERTAGEVFNISLQPSRPEQGGVLNVAVNVLKPLTEMPQGYIYLPDGRKISIDLKGQAVLKGSYTIPSDILPGMAMLEVVAGAVHESMDFGIIVSADWRKRLNKDSFYKIRASSDPAIIGRPTTFIIETLGDQASPPAMELLMPGGMRVAVQLNGGPRTFLGTYTPLAGTMPGRAEIILNPGTSDEIRRPFGIQDVPVITRQGSGAILVNPQPLIAGKPFDVQVDSDHQLEYTPRLLLRQSDGREIPVDLEGSLPARSFKGRGIIPVDSVIGLAQFILKDDQGTTINKLSTQVMPSLEAIGSDSRQVSIQISPVLPIINRQLNVMANFIIAPIFTPKIFIEFQGGMRRNYTFPQAPGMLQYTYAIPAADILAPVTRVGIENAGGVILQEIFLMSNSTPGAISVMVIPDQPSVNVALNVMAHFTSAPAYTPRFFIELQGGMRRSYTFPQAPGMLQYAYAIPAADMTAPLVRIGIENNTGTIVHERKFTAGALSVNIITTPEPPVTGAALQVNASFSAATFFVPRLIVEMSNGSRRSYVFASSGRMNYQMNIPAADLVAPVTAIFIEDNAGMLVGNKRFFSAAGTRYSTAVDYPTGLGRSITGIPGEIRVNWNRVAGTDIAGYRVYYGTSSRNYTGNGSPASPVILADPNATSTIISGLTNGTTYYIAVQAYNTSNIQSNNPNEIMAIPGVASVSAVFDHIHLSAGSTTSNIGKPVFVSLRAHDSSHNPVTTFTDPVTIMVSESSMGRIDHSWLVSVQDRVTAGAASTGSVAMFAGKGFFTVDALEPETITVGVSSHSNGGNMEFAFSASPSATVSSFALDGPGKAKTGVAAGEGALIYISPVDGAGKVNAGYIGNAAIILTDPVAITTGLLLVKGNGNLSGNSPDYTYQFSPSDKGVAIFRLTDTVSETVQVTIGANSLALDFEDLQKFVISKNTDTHPGTSFEVIGLTQAFTVRSALSNGQPIAAYSGTATYTCSAGCGTVSAVPVLLNFNNGEASFSLSDTQFHTVTFTIANGSVTTGNINMKFQSVDANPPEVIKVIAETPWLIHIYFSEDINQANAMRSGNYSVTGASIDKVCWYGDNITLHLSAALTLSSALSVTVKGSTSQGVNGIKDMNGNFILNDISKNSNVPGADYQGHRIGGSDWFEVQPSKLNPANGEIVEVTVYHKNACGYLKGSNASNSTTASAGSGSASVSYGSGNVSGDNVVTISDGVGRFRFSPAISAQSFTINVSKDGVSGTTAITVP